MTHWDAIVIGGGLAGSAAAIELAIGGKRVLLLEKEIYPHHKVCGEFLSYEAQYYLDKLGIDYKALGAVPIDTLQLIYSNKSIAVRLPFQGVSVSRLLLDEVLLQKATESGVTVKRGVTVKDAVQTPNGWVVNTDNTSYESDNILLATGKRDLRDLPRQKGTQNNYIGFKMHWKLLPYSIEALQNTVSIIWFDGGYAGLELVENEIANLSLVVTKQRFSEVGKQWELLLTAIRREAPSLDKYLIGATPEWEKPLAVFDIPYGFVYKEGKTEKKGLYRLGDQLAVIPSFSGDGMAIALHTASRAADAILTGSTTYHQNIRGEFSLKLDLLLYCHGSLPAAGVRKLLLHSANDFQKYSYISLARQDWLTLILINFQSCKLLEIK